MSDATFTSRAMNLPWLIFRRRERRWMIARVPVGTWQ